MRLLTLVCTGPRLLDIHANALLSRSDVSMETALNIDHTPGKVKKRYRKKKTKLEEVFPSYLQVSLSNTLTGKPSLLVLIAFAVLSYRRPSSVRIFLIRVGRGGGGWDQGPSSIPSGAPTNW